jgi:hypothetical protein
LPAWYETGLAFLLLFLSGGVLTALFLIMRIRMANRRSEVLENTVQERTTEIKLKNDQLEQQAQQLLEMDRVKSSFFANISRKF